jgi:tRNA-dihydrouridine synthase A
MSFDAPLNRKFSIAPMMEWTDRHYRYFARLMSRHTVLYTEMVTTGAIIYGDEERHLAYNDEEHPVALQLGGSNIADLAKCASIADKRGYDEVNLNVGCPSDRVQNNMIGACLMGHAALVSDCLSAMQENCQIPVTIKHRIGIDDLDSEQFLMDFVGTVKESGCTTFIVHARKAILDGLSPKENREIPPLIYDRVYRLKQHYPDLEIIINGGIKTLQECETHLSHVDGVMIGREAYQHPWLLSEIDRLIYGEESSPYTNRKDVLLAMFPYLERQLSQGQKLNYMTRHLLGLFHGQAGGKQFRRYISENAHLPGADLEVLRKALDLIKD